MNYLDHRLSKRLSEIRIEQARLIRKRGLHSQSERLIDQSLRLSAVTREDQPSGDASRAA